jgi:hypothetical protein
LTCNSRSRFNCAPLSDAGKKDLIRLITDKVDYLAGMDAGAKKMFDPEWPRGQAPHEIGCQPFGNIHIANSDAGAFAYTNEAIDQRWRTVGEIVAKKR